ncbi:MAG: DUF433 domain-containing protein [Verrucomicrobiota bacterium]
MTTLEEARSIVSRLDLDERVRLMDWLSRDSVEVAPGIFRTTGVCGGDACIRAMRIAVWMLEEGRRNGFTEEIFFEAYPALTRTDLQNAWAYVASRPEEIENLIRENNEMMG